MSFLSEVKNRIVLGDGAIGTMLQELGLKVGDCPELWNAQYPEKVEKVHTLYAEAGAEVFTTNTFGGSGLKLAKFGLADRVEELNRKGAEIARKVAGSRGFVAASIGPTGEFLEPLGTVSRDQMLKSFRLQARGLDKGGVDFFQIETMSDLDEAALAVQAVREVSDLPVLLSFTFNPVKNGFRTMMGVSTRDVVARFGDDQTDLLGVNCGTGIDEAIQLIEELSKLTQKPLFAAPNAGVPQLVDNQTRFSQSPEYFADRLPLLIKAGARFVAGCCGTTPEYIHKMKKVLEM